MSATVDRIDPDVDELYTISNGSIDDKYPTGKIHLRTKSLETTDTTSATTPEYPYAVLEAKSMTSLEATIRDAAQAVQDYGRPLFGRYSHIRWVIQPRDIAGIDRTAFETEKVAQIRGILQASRIATYDDNVSSDNRDLTPATFAAESFARYNGQAPPDIRQEGNVYYLPARLTGRRHQM